MTSVDTDAREHQASFDCVLVATNHAAFDYAHGRRDMRSSIVDTRDAMREHSMTPLGERLVLA